MAINPIHVPRISFGLRTQTLLEQLTRNQGRLFFEEQRVATGRALLSAGDDPIAAGKVVRLSDRLVRQDQILANLQHADRWLTAGESAVTNIADLLIEAKSIALEQVNSFQTSEQRASAAIIVDGIIDQLITVGNQQFAGRYLFGGRRTTEAPFDTLLGRAQFVGDRGDRNTVVDFGLERPFNLPADQLFGLTDDILPGFADLNPAVSVNTRIADLNGAAGAGVRPGSIKATQIGGAGAGNFTFDITGIDTLGEFVTRFNGAATAAGVGLSASLTVNGVQVSGAAGSQVMVEEVSNGTTAADLGILGTSGVGAPLVGADIDPRVVAQTPLTSLNGGAGLALPTGLLITNGGLSRTVTFAGASTVQDVLNQINGSDAAVRATINAAGSGLEILNELAGYDLTIGENGGTDATALGIRSLYAGTPLASLNSGHGVSLVSGPDLRIIDANNIAFDVELDGSSTVQDVIDAINAAATAAGSTLQAGLRPVGSGLRLSHPAPGVQNIAVERGPGLAQTADDLGIFGTGTNQILDGADVNPIRQSGMLSALYRLADGLRANDSQAITAAGADIEEAIRLVAAQQGQLGARSRALSERLVRTEDAVLATQRFVSELADVDLSEAITKFQQAQLALQANLQAGSSLLNLSLLDFLN